MASASYEPFAKSRRQANPIKREEAITVVLGNPPYKEKAKGRRLGRGGRERQTAAPLDGWMPPPDWGVGAHAKHLQQSLRLFLALGDVESFRRRPLAATGRPDTDEGIVCFITVAGFLNGPGFQKMRDDLRRTRDEIWVIDCSPEGHQPPVAARVFQGVQQPVCIVIASRRASAERTPCARALPQPAGGRSIR